MTDEHGGHLASVTSPEINDFIGQNMESLTRRWIGASDSELEGAWTWSDGSPWGFSYWNAYKSFSPKNCAKMHKISTLALWYEESCDYQYKFVCTKVLCSGE